MSKRYDPPARVDKNQPQLVEKFRSLGASVVITSQVGHGFTDIVIGINGYDALVEIKSETGKLTKDQEVFHASWSGIIWIARTEDDVEKIVKFYSDLAPLDNKQILLLDQSLQDVSEASHSLPDDLDSAS